MKRFKQSSCGRFLIIRENLLGTPHYAQLVREGRFAEAKREIFEREVEDNYYEDKGSYYDELAAIEKQHLKDSKAALVRR